MRDTRQITPLVRELRYQCEDVDCGLTFRAELVITHEISPSGRPRPGLKLPRLQPKPVNDNAAPAVAANV